MTEEDKLVAILVNQLPDDVDEYGYEMVWYSDGDSSGKGKFIKNGEKFKTNLALKELMSISDVALQIVQLKKDVGINKVSLLVKKDGSHDCKAEFDKSIDADREDEIRNTLGEEEYEKLKKESISSENKNENQPPESMPEDSLTLGQLIGVIRDELQGVVPKEWVSLVLKTRIVKQGQQQSIETDFIWQDKAGNEKLFEPENPFTSMNAILQIKDIMVNDGNDWSKFKLIIHSNGEADIQNQF